MVRRVGVSAFAAAAALVLAGCGGGSGASSPTGGGGSSGSSGSSSSGTGPGSSSSPAVVDGVTLTAPGSQLKLGETAKISWKPDQKTVGVIALSVTKLQKEPIKTFSAWRLGPAAQKSTPYFVRATVRNLGRTNLSGKPVPLYLLDGRNTLLQSSTFQARFAPCPSRPLPARFKHDRKTSVCLVYFAPDHGKLVAMSFRPTQDFDAITWKGKVSGSKPAKHKKKH